jgi:poly(hydroxyalkanoate) depolymerase family esterase
VVGSERHAFAAVEPLLRELGQTVTQIGPAGQGLLLKLAINISLAVQTARPRLVRRGPAPRELPSDMKRLLRTLGLAFLVTFPALLPVTAASAAAFPGPGRYTHETYTSHGDTYTYALYVPATYRPGQHVPLVVMIHACNTTADQQAQASEYDTLAEQHDFIVLYPDSDVVDQGTIHCWKAFGGPQLEGRGRGDAAAIAGMTRMVSSAGSIDPTRVYAIGMSSGGFETSVLGAEYPDVYAAIGIHSAAAFIHGMNGCFLIHAPTQSTDSLARAAYTAEGPRARIVPVILFHGDNDHIVPYQCGQKALAQWLETDNDVLSAAGAPTIPATPATTTNGQVSGGYAYTVDSYEQADGCAIAQFWTIHGMGHYWSGGSSDPAAAPSTDPKGPSATAASWAFFSAHRLTQPGASSPCVSTTSQRTVSTTSQRTGCPRATGRLRGRTLGPVKLDETREQVRRGLRRTVDSRARYTDVFCFRPSGIRVGFPPPAVAKRLTRSARRAIAGRVVLILTANPHYALRGVRPGTPVASAKRKLRLGRPISIGANTWYLTPMTGATGVLKVRHGVIEEVGIADPRFTTPRRLTTLLLATF